MTVGFDRVNVVSIRGKGGLGGLLEQKPESIQGLCCSPFTFTSTPTSPSQNTCINSLSQLPPHPAVGAYIPLGTPGKAHVWLSACLSL